MRIKGECAYVMCQVWGMDTGIGELGDSVSLDASSSPVTTLIGE